VQQDKKKRKVITYHDNIITATTLMLPQEVKFAAPMP
jgi:hypothetical protein